MAKVQGRKRRDRAGDEPAESSVDAPASEPTTQRAGRSEGPADADVVPAPRRFAPGSTTARLRLSVLDSTPVLLLQATHPRQALATGAGLAVVALAAGRDPREAAVVAATAVVGQAVLGWHNDLVDRAVDDRHDVPHKPVADGRLDPGTTWYALVIALLLVVPLSISTGVTAGLYYLAALVVGLSGNVALRRGRLSWVSWATQFALYAPYVALGGWGGDAQGDPPEVAMVVLFALLGVGVHVLRAIWGLVADDAEGWSTLPLVLGRRLGAARLLVVTAAYLGVVVAAMVVVGATVGLRQ
ncbi:UbiA family prenyltransferase [Nocardioides plantarum]|uniref:UbiA family prenyltransferase n=1 Tax=Nocardioides plantarum TaxID=29299 RepID=A0ABV5K6X6_9ACTN|nr:UbiA family prenyltransferase [Nocardioides plantarum]